MSIWFNDVTLEKLQASQKGTSNLTTHIGIEYTDLGDDFISAKMPVDERSKQPYGLLHGGASCVLAETLGSVASALCVDASKYIVVGLEINANHLRPATSGYVVGTVKPIHLGRKTHVWDIRIETESDKKLVCVSRLTVAVLDKP
jgi:1,4-dihydroxy-2-naphthoyl-CoA hydrolase